MSSDRRRAPVVLVTGATGGLGTTFAEYFADRGWAVVLSSRKADVVERLAVKLGSDHNAAHVEVVAADLATSAGIKALAAYCSSQRIDVVISNAGAAHTRPFPALPAEVIEHEIMLNFNAHVMIAHAVLPQMTKRGCGSLVFVSSLAGLIPADNDSGYVAAKAGLIGLAESLRYQLRGSGVQVSALCPGFVRTNIYRAAGDEDPDIPAWMWSSPERTVDLGMRRVIQSRKAIVIPERRDRILLAGWRILPQALRTRAAQVMYDPE